MVGRSLARDTRLDRDVALKVLPAAVAADPDRRARFEREAKAVAALDHPHIVTIHSVEEDQGVPFFTMQYVEGCTLRDLIPARGLPLADLLAIAIPLADALSATHARCILHRDLKPANVMVTPEGRVKVLDFGLAKLRPDLPREFARIVKQALTKDPERRYRTAKDVRNELEVLKADIDSGELARSTKTSAPARARRRLVWQGMIAAAAVAVIAAGLFSAPWLRFQVLTSALHLLGEHDQELAEARRGRAVYPDLLHVHAYEASLTMAGRAATRRSRS